MCELLDVTCQTTGHCVRLETKSLVIGNLLHKISACDRSLKLGRIIINSLCKRENRESMVLGRSENNVIRRTLNRFVEHFVNLMCCNEFSTQEDTGRK